MLNWLRPFSIFCFLDNQQYGIVPHNTEWLVAAGVQEFVQGSDIREADTFVSHHRWVFGHLAYELQHAAHKIAAAKKDKIGFPGFYFFVPQMVLEYDGELRIYANDPQQVFAQIMAYDEQVEGADLLCGPAPVLSREEYLQKIRALQAHIQRGDCYEINFCQEFAVANCMIDPFSAFQKLVNVSPNPFSAFYRLEDKFLVCASPERFLAKKGKRIFSQPIKGTIKRDLLSPEKDEQLKQALRKSQKEQSENVMVVDLVRNDLTKICKEATVKVDELFGIYSFPQVHQMISTISGELLEDVPFSTIIEATFPMGSMTGAPKHRVMQLIEEYEASARGIFSGSVGYFHPNGDFDFNVVIRSMMYNEAAQYLSYQVGSGITFYCNAENEWEECMLKAEAIKQVLAF